AEITARRFSPCDCCGKSSPDGARAKSAIGRCGTPPHEHRALFARLDLKKSAPAGRQSSRLPSANTWDQPRMRTECRKPVGQNGSAFTSASMTSGLSASTIHSPPTGSPDSARNGPAALIRVAREMTSGQPCGGGERRRRASRVFEQDDIKHLGFSERPG